MPTPERCGENGDRNSIRESVRCGYASLPGSLAGRGTKAAPDKNPAGSNSQREGKKWTRRINLNQRKNANATRLTIRSLAGVTFSRPSLGPKRICHFICDVIARASLSDGTIQGQYREE